MRRLLPIVAAVALVAGVCGTSQAGTVQRATTTVTINTQNGEFWGYLTSPKPKACADNRNVTLFKQVGSTQDPSVDKKMASDISSLSGKRYKWTTGTTGLRHGKFYARVTRTPLCKAATSQTIRASSGGGTLG